MKLKKKKPGYYASWLFLAFFKKFTIQNTKFEFFLMANKILFIVLKMNLCWDKNSNFKKFQCELIETLTRLRFLQSPASLTSTSNRRILHIFLQIGTS